MGKGNLKEALRKLNKYYINKGKEIQKKKLN